MLQYFLWSLQPLRKHSCPQKYACLHLLTFKKQQTNANSTCYIALELGGLQ